MGLNEIKHTEGLAWCQAVSRPHRVQPPPWLVDIRSAVKVVDLEGCGLGMWKSRTQSQETLGHPDWPGKLGSPTPNLSRKVVERDDLSWVCQECKGLTVLYPDQFSGLYLLQAPLRVRVMSPSGQRGGLLTMLSESMAASIKLRDLQLWSKPTAWPASTWTQLHGPVWCRPQRHGGVGNASVTLRLLSVLWITKSFVSDSGVSRLLPASLEQ